MSDRPADTIAHLADYLWWLLPTFMKRKERRLALTGALVDLLGGVLDDARGTLTEIVPRLLSATATAEYLDRLARQRSVFRGVGETDASLRTRVLAALAIKRMGGTLPGMVQGLATLGYVVEVLETYRSTPHWSHFLVRILGWDGVVTDQWVFYDTVRRLKPAHTRAVYECLCPATWDDWEPGDTPRTFDDAGGTLDDFFPTP
jgi:P2-related tail formation protein